MSLLARMFSKTREPPAACPVTTYLANLAPGSRAAQRTALDRVAGILTDERDSDQVVWHQLEYRDTAAVRSALMKQVEPTTANRYLSALRSVLRECWRLGLMDLEACQRACEVGSIPGQPLPRGRRLTAEELAALLNACAGGDALDVRDRAMILVLARCGLRRAELVQLDLADLRLDQKLLVVRAGKGRRDGEVPISGGVIEGLRPWLELRGDQPGPMFLPIGKGTLPRHRKMSAQAAGKMLQRRSAQAGIGPVSPHDLRRTFTSDLLDAGVDLSTVQRLARHRDIATTAIYDRRGDEVRRQAVERLE